MNNHVVLVQRGSTQGFMHLLQALKKQKKALGSVKRPIELQMHGKSVEECLVDEAEARPGSYRVLWGRVKRLLQRLDHEVPCGFQGLSSDVWVGLDVPHTVELDAVLEALLKPDNRSSPSDATTHFTEDGQQSAH